MNFLTDKRKRKILIIISSVVLTLAIILGACAIYLGDYYHADDGAVASTIVLDIVFDNIQENYIEDILENN